jgi:hypothetical protein
MEFLHRELFAGFTVMEVGIAAIALIAFVVIARAVFGRRGAGAGNHLVPASCRSCGWSGQVGRYNRTCKQCGAPL